MDIGSRRRTLREKQALGQYFTPRSVARATWELLALFQSEGRSRRPSCTGRILEPAVGEGIFLEVGRELGAQGPMLGVDLDAQLEPAWQRLHWRVSDLALVRANALLPHASLVPGFEVVIGNPPYGATQLNDLAASKSPEAVASLRTLVERYQCFRTTPGLRREAEVDERSSRAGIRKLATFPIECLFVERSLELCAPGGWIALVLPEGLLTNSRLQSVRDFVSERACVRAVISLPGSLFRSEGAAARTALLVLQKTATASDAFLASAEHEEDLPAILDAAEAFVRDRKASPAIAVSERRLTGERWDPGYWDPRFTTALDDLEGLELVELGHFLSFMTYGPIVTGGERQSTGDVPVIHQGQLTPSGLDLRDAKRVAADSVHDPARSRPKARDLLFARSGVGSLAKGRMAVLDSSLRANVGCFVDILRFQDLDPYYAWLFLASRFGQVQIRRVINGVATPNLSFKEIKSLHIPLLPLEQQRRLARVYHEDVFPRHLAFLEAPGEDKRARETASAAMQAALARFESQLTSI